MDLLNKEAVLDLKNAKIDMYKGSMRLAVDKAGSVSVAEGKSINVKEDNNLSAVEYELITVTDQPAQPPPAAKPTSEAQPTVA